MQLIHECGHVLGAWATGGEVRRVVLHPMTISRTDLGRNPHPLIVAWAGPMLGALFPLALWSALAGRRVPGLFVLRFFAWFCLIANGAYIAVGSLERIGDCGEMLRHGSEMWQLWLFGAVTTPLGFWLWNDQGTRFGLGSANGEVSRGASYVMLGVALSLLAVGLLVDGV